MNKRTQRRYPPGNRRDPGRVAPASVPREDVSVSQKSMWAVFLVALMALVGGTSTGGEPDGYLSFRYERVESEEETGAGGPEVVHLDVRSRVDLTDGRLTLAIPDGIGLRILNPSWQEKLRETVADDGSRRLEADLEGFGPSAPIRLHLEFRPPSDGGGIVSFTVGGVTPDGRTIREATGMSVGHPGSRGTRRHGAVEYPAVPYDGAER